MPNCWKACGWVQTAQSRLHNSSVLSASTNPCSWATTNTTQENSCRIFWTEFMKTSTESRISLTLRPKTMMAGLISMLPNKPGKLISREIRQWWSITCSASSSLLWTVPTASLSPFSLTPSSFALCPSWMTTSKKCKSSTCETISTWRHWPFATTPLGTGKCKTLTNKSKRN